MHSKNKLFGSCNELVSKNYNDKTILKEQTNIYFFLISNLRKGYGMTGISFRPFNRIKKEDFEENSKIFAIWGLNVPLYKKISIRLSDFELKEDYAINLALLQSGYKNIVSFYYAFDKTSGANSEGGCSTFRIIKKSDESALKLKETFPDFVRLNKKSTKNWGVKFKEQMEMLEVVVYWKEAYKIKG